MSTPPRKRAKLDQNNKFVLNKFIIREAEETNPESENDENGNEEVEESSLLEQHKRDTENRIRRKMINDSFSNKKRVDNLLDQLEQKYVIPDYVDDAAEMSMRRKRPINYQHNEPISSSQFRKQISINEDNFENNDNTQAGEESISRVMSSSYDESPFDIQATLPSVSDPKLWLVPCIQGKERTSVIEIMKRYFKYKDNPAKQLFITTAFTTDMNTGYIYVEAFKEIFVRRAIDGIFGLNKFKIRLVPSGEMQSSLTIQISGPEVRRGQWCRFNRGLFKADLAQVHDVLDQGSRVIVRVVPRIDLARLSIAHNTKNKKKDKNGKENNNDSTDGSNANTFVRSRGHRPPQRLFNPNEMEDLNEIVESTEMDNILRCRVYKWRGKKYRHGFQLLNVPVVYLDFDVTATPEEVARLRAKVANQDDDDIDEDLDKAAPPIISSTCNFVRGDTVKVIKGPLINLVGEVIATQPNPIDGKITVHVKPEHKELTNTIPFPTDQLQKYFKIGCHVKCTKGTYKDETGLIIKVDEDLNEVVLFSDLTSREIRVSIDEITETSEVSTGRDVLGNYSLYELVALSRDVVGVIVDIQIGTFTILDNKGEVQSCQLQDITRHTKDHHAVALDIENQQIRISDVVIPQLGDFKGQRATVKHIYRAVLFCHTKSCTTNAGIFVIRSRLCRLAGGRIKNTNDVLRLDTSNDQRLRIIHGRRSTKDPWMGQTVKIKKGVWKGYMGIVKACTDQNLRVELHAKYKVISVRREEVQVINIDGTEIRDDQSFDDKPSSNNNNNYNYANNNYNNSNNARNYNMASTRNTNHYNINSSGGETPNIGAKTPYGLDVIGGRTPAIGAQTPAIGGTTPAYGNDGMIATPNINESYKQGVGNEGDRTPLGLTPHHGNMTPHNEGNSSPPFHNNNSPHHGKNNNNGYNQYDFNTNNENSYNNYSNNHIDYSNNNYYYDNKNSNSNMNANPNVNPNDAENINENEDNNLSEDSATESNNVERAKQNDPFYFIIPDAELYYENQRICYVESVDKTQNIGVIVLKDTGERLTVPLTTLTHKLPTENGPISVVYGRLQGEQGTLIGIDQNDVIAQMESSREVTIINRYLVVGLRQRENDIDT